MQLGLGLNLPARATRGGQIKLVPLSLSNDEFDYGADSADVKSRIVGKKSRSVLTVEPGILTNVVDAVTVTELLGSVSLQTIIPVSVAAAYNLATALGDDLLEWWDAANAASLGSPSDGAAISLWEGAKTSRDSVQATANNQPHYRANGLNNRPGVEVHKTPDISIDDWMVSNAAVPASWAGSNAVDIYMTMDQQTLASITTTLRAFAYGANNTTASRSVQRFVDGGKNLLRIASDNGGAAVTVDVIGANFSGLCLVRAKFTGAAIQGELKGVMSAIVTAVSNTGTTRHRIATSTINSPTDTLGCTIGKIVITKGEGTATMTSDKVAALRKYLLDEVDPCWGIHSYGSSSGGPGGSAEPVLTNPVYPEKIFQFTDGPAQGGSSAVDPGDLDALEPTADLDGTPPHPAISFGVAFEALSRSQSWNPPRIVARADYKGGEQIQNLKQGSTTYENLMASIAAGDALGRADFNRAYQPAILIQCNNGSSDIETFSGHLEDIVAAMLTDVTAAIGVAPHILIPQVGSEVESSSVHGNIALAQNDVCEARDGTNVVMIGPQYHLPRADDGEHNSAIGTMMLGEVAALALRSIDVTGTFRPLQPDTINRVGRIITITFESPGGAEVEIDEDWIAPAANYGFTYTETLVPENDILSVTKTGPLEFEIELTHDPDNENSGRIEYAIDALPIVGAPWQRARGQLYADSGVASPFAALGYDVPANIRYYLKRFGRSF